jgi:hypothetical protein
MPKVSARWLDKHGPAATGAVFVAVTVTVGAALV